MFTLSYNSFFMWNDFFVSKEKVVESILSKYDSTDYIKSIFSKIKDNYSEKYVNDFFSEVYDELYHDILLKKTYISLDTKKMLESLALPIYKKTSEEKAKIYKKIKNY